MLAARPQKSKPAHNRLGTFAQELAAVRLSVYLARRRGTTAADQWADARRLAVPKRRGAK